eukprot:10724801-Alexandrium_andersonii.AAC.1
MEGLRRPVRERKALPLPKGDRGSGNPGKGGERTGEALIGGLRDIAGLESSVVPHQLGTRGIRNLRTMQFKRSGLALAGLRNRE